MDYILLVISNILYNISCFKVLHIRTPLSTSAVSILSRISSVTEACQSPSRFPCFITQSKVFFVLFRAEANAVPPEITEYLLWTIKWLAGKQPLPYRPETRSSSIISKCQPQLYSALTANWLQQGCESTSETELLRNSSSRITEQRSLWIICGIVSVLVGCRVNMVRAA